VIRSMLPNFAAGFRGLPLVAGESDDEQPAVDIILQPPFDRAAGARRRAVFKGALHRSVAHTQWARVQRAELLNLLKGLEPVASRIIVFTR